MAQILNISNLIEKSPITRLSKDYENRLINKIKDNFNEKEQQIFVTSFYCFLNYDTKKDFVVDFDSAWKWTGFSRKSDAKRVLEKHFIIDIDYQVKSFAAENSAKVGNNTFPVTSGKVENNFVKPAAETCAAGHKDDNTVFDNFDNKYTENDGSKAAPPTSGTAFEKRNLGGSGLNKENILLTVNTFKKFCLKAGTKKADEIHDYYIKLEELLHETVNEETNELKLQLTKAEHNLKNEVVQRQILKAKYERFLDRRIDIDKFEKRSCVYIIGCHETPDRFKIGYTGDLNKRFSDYHTEMTYNPVVYYKKYVEEAKFIESVIHHVLRKFRIYNNKEWFKTDDKQIFIDALENIVSFFEIEDKKHENVIDIKIAFDKNEYTNEHLMIKTDDILSNSETDNEILSEKENTEDILSDEPLEEKTESDNEILSEKENTEDILSDEPLEEKTESVNTKVCSKCKSNLPFDNFAKNPKKKNGMDGYCKKCNNERYKQNKNKKKIELSEKKCTKCDTIKDISEFYSRVGSIDGKTSECKDCCMDMYRNRAENREYTEAPDIKECLQCKKVLEIYNFGNKNDSPDGKMSYCKMCCSENAKNNRLIPKECLSKTKKCNKCNIEKDIENFWNSKSNKDGKDNKCRDCHKNK